MLMQTIATVRCRVERGIGHHLVGLADHFMGIFLVGDRLLDVPLQPVDGRVHFRQADGGGVLLQP